MHQLLTNFCSAFGYHLDYYQRDSKATVNHHHFTLNVSCVPIIPTFALCSHRHLGTLTNRSSKETSQRHAKQSGAVEACWAHNPEVRGSKPRSAIFIFIFISKKNAILSSKIRRERGSYLCELENIRYFGYSKKIPFVVLFWFSLK